jgi:hypothetical protein
MPFPLNLSGYEKTRTENILKRTLRRDMFWVSSSNLWFLGEPPYLRYLCRGLVVACRARVEFCSVLAVPEGKRFLRKAGLPDYW